MFLSPEASSLGQGSRMGRVAKEGGLLSTPRWPCVHHSSGFWLFEVEPCCVGWS